MTAAPDDFLAPAALEQVTTSALELAMAAAGPDGQAEISASAGEGLSVTVRDGDCETIEFERDKSLAVTIYQGGRKGSATTSDFSPAALQESIDAACQIAANGEVDEYARLADPEHMAGDAANRDLDLDHPWDLEPGAAIALGVACEKVAVGSDPRIKQGDGVGVNRYRGTRAYANSHGFHAAYRGTRHSLSAVMIASDADNNMQRGYWYSSDRDPARLEDAESVGRRAAERTVSKLGAKKIATTECPVMFEPRVAQSLIGHLVSAISGGAQYRRASFLLDAVGEAVLPAHVSLVERPHLPGATGSAPFDNDGLATRDNTLVADGVLKSYVLSAYAARRLGLAPTGNAGGTHNLIVTPGEASFEALIAGIERGVLVTDLMGFGVNNVTGDYSRGASGFLIEGGALAGPVEEITIAGNLRDMLLGIRAIGSDVDESMAVRTGSIVIEKMAIAGA